MDPDATLSPKRFEVACCMPQGSSTGLRVPIFLASLASFVESKVLLVCAGVCVCVEGGDSMIR